MNKLVYIVENFTDSADYRDLIQAVLDSGRKCYAIDRTNKFNFEPDKYKEHPLILFQGSIQMTKLARARLPLTCQPVCFSSWDKYLCTKYYPYFQDYLFNDKHRIVKLSELKEFKFDFYREFGKEAMIFCRPDSGEKTFQAQLLDLQDFDRFWNNSLGGGECKDSDLVVVSTPKSINSEFRFVVSGDEIIAQSSYQYQGQKTFIPSAPTKATIFVKNLLTIDYKPDKVFCIDVVEDADGNFWLMELTSFSSAGLYACDKNKIVERVSEIIESNH